jgi:NAD(P)H-dependent FMN reductase
VERKLFRIIAIAGSLRQGSFNQRLLRAAKEVAPAWVEVQFFDIGQFRAMLLALLAREEGKSCIAAL